MAKCPECQGVLTMIGTEKFSYRHEEQNNFSIDGVGYKILIAAYCHKCNVIIFREPTTVYG